MDQIKTIATMRLVGGHPCLDFVNTVDARRDRWGPDLLESYSDLIKWAERVRAIDPIISADLRKAASSDPEAAADALRRAKAVREVVFTLFHAEAVGSEAPRHERELFRTAVENALRQRTLICDGGWTWQWRNGNGLDGILHRVVYAAADLATQRDARRPVRECVGDNCGWLFLDTSRGGRRRWCSDETCGSHNRVKRFRAKAIGV